jgi:hypothetical protein
MGSHLQCKIPWWQLYFHSDSLVCIDWQRNRDGQQAVEWNRGGMIVPKIRVAIVGVGNCASALMQGIDRWKDASSRLNNRNSMWFPSCETAGRKYVLMEKFIKGEINS